MLKFVLKLLVLGKIPFPQLLDKFINASKEYKNNDIWFRGLNIENSKPFYETYEIYSKKDYREGVACFRIPSLINLNSSILAFTEARLYNCSDCSEKGIVVKRSLDAGVTWSNWKWLVEPSLIGANPTSVYDDINKKIILHYSTGKTNLSGQIDCIPSKENYQISSNNFGLTWSKPYKITKFLGDYGGLLSGPGNGVQIPSSGRLVFPGHYQTAERKDGAVISYYSDDYGLTWKTSNTVLMKQDESTINLIENETLIMNMRNGHNNNSCNCRAQVFSNDGGVNWLNLTFDPELKDPICQGTSTYLDGYYYFLNPNMYYSRSNLTLRFKKNILDKWKEIRITDEFNYAGYTALTNKIISLNSKKYLGILWTGCDLSLPFRVWCSIDSAWKLFFSRVPI